MAARTRYDYDLVILGAGSAGIVAGNVAGYPGYNAAGVVARALGLTPWWTPPDWLGTEA